GVELAEAVALGADGEAAEVAGGVLGGVGPEQGGQAGQAEGAGPEEPTAAEGLRLRGGHGCRPLVAGGGRSGGQWRPTAPGRRVRAAAAARRSGRDGGAGRNGWGRRESGAGSGAGFRSRRAGGTMAGGGCAFARPERDPEGGERTMRRVRAGLIVVAAVLGIP